MQERTGERLRLLGEVGVQLLELRHRPALGTGAGESSSLADVNVCNREDSIVRYENASFQK